MIMTVQRPTEADRREAAFERHLASKVEYFDTIRANGDVPWFERDMPADLTEAEREQLGLARRRELFMRRYERPKAPQ